MATVAEAKFPMFIGVIGSLDSIILTCFSSVGVSASIVTLTIALHCLETLVPAEKKIPKSYSK
jgi:hypothetical protein